MGRFLHYGQIYVTFTLLLGKQLISGTIKLYSRYKRRWEAAALSKAPSGGGSLLGPEHAAVVALSVSGDLDGQELNPGGWKQETHEFRSLTLQNPARGDESVPNIEFSSE